jgi:hypothetical protein
MTCGLGLRRRFEGCEDREQGRYRGEECCDKDVGVGEVVVGVPTRIVRRKGERSRMERRQGK